MAGNTSKQVIQASNAALITGVVLIIIGAAVGSVRFLLFVGIFLLAVAIGLTLFNRSLRKSRLGDQQPPPA